jgi:hypothetical protein
LSADELPDGVIAELANLTVVQHGIDVDRNGQYNLASRIGESAFAQSKGMKGVPHEATFPANCGVAPGAAASSPSGGGASEPGA